MKCPYKQNLQVPWSLTEKSLFPQTCNSWGGHFTYNSLIMTKLDNCYRWQVVNQLLSMKPFWCLLERVVWRLNSAILLNWKKIRTFIQAIYLRIWLYIDWIRVKKRCELFLLCIWTLKYALDATLIVYIYNKEEQLKSSLACRKPLKLSENNCKMKVREL